MGHQRQVRLKSISAYRAGDTETVIDFDSTPENELDIPAIYNDHQFSQEFQLSTPANGCRASSASTT